QTTFCRFDEYCPQRRQGRWPGRGVAASLFDPWRRQGDLVDRASIGRGQRRPTRVVFPDNREKNVSAPEKPPSDAHNLLQISNLASIVGSRPAAEFAPQIERRQRIGRGIRQHRCFLVSHACGSSFIVSFASKSHYRN